MDSMAYIEATDLFVIMLFVDTVCVVYNDFRSHTSSATTLEYGIIYSMSSKQKISTNSSMCTELASVSNYFPKLLRTKLFLKAQGIVLKGNIAY